MTTIEIKELDFPPYAEFARGGNIKILDYQLSFSVMVEKTELGEWRGNRKFHVSGKDIPAEFSDGLPITEENYERAKVVIETSRMKRIYALIG